MPKGVRVQISPWLPILPLWPNEQEFEAFKEPDGRSRVWLLMDRTKAEKLSGYAKK